MTSASSVIVLWSGGKDAAWMLYELLNDSKVQVDGLLTTVIEGANTVTTHGTPTDLIEQQANALGLPLHLMCVPPEPSNATYEEHLERALAPLRAQGVAAVAAGDLHLEDIRRYRSNLFRRFQMTPMFPIWGRDTHVLAQDMLDRGFQSVVSSVDTTQLDARYVGRAYNEEFLSDLPDGVDPCGENGEFHTFTTDAPMFAEAIPVCVTETRGTGRMRYAQLSSL
ncbi:hypothetical protein CRI94_01185 [Longibacter salinarum]|uniref:Diphthamide synthase domain-containing protein n=1 Tax=Longibacter salinarum TaxID=1850348 RepID=A0A2A8D1X3_9BACT|nr:hypothetical protein [Longibacter salinarum]PEN14935.1 hypothetical protein CRI94_01185 [Longibacter salinarum]